MTSLSSTPSAVLIFGRDDHFFVDNASMVEDLELRRALNILGPDQILHPQVPQHYIVRKGKIRISQFLDDGREITRAVLQAGSVFFTQWTNDDGDKPAADLYNLSGIVIMALAETELWSFAENALDDCKL